MNIKSLEQMEEIVNSNNNLFWDGWSVVNRYRSEKGRTSKYGAYIDKKWYMTRRFNLNRSGWDIPESFVNAQIKMER